MIFIPPLNHRPRRKQEGLFRDVGHADNKFTQMIYRESNNAVQGLNSPQLSSTCTVALVNAAALWFGGEFVVWEWGGNETVNTLLLWAGKTDDLK